MRLAVARVLSVEGGGERLFAAREGGGVAALASIDDVGHRPVDRGVAGGLAGGGVAGEVGGEFDGAGRGGLVGRRGPRTDDADAVVGERRVRHLGDDLRHVTRRAVGRRRVIGAGGRGDGGGERRRRVARQAGAVEVRRSGLAEALVRIVACRALHRARRRLRLQETRALLHPLGVRDDPDRPALLHRRGDGRENRLLRLERTARTVAVRRLALAQQHHGPLEMALLAHVEAPRERQVLGVDDGPVRRVACFRVGEARLDMEGARPVAPLAPDAERHLGELVARARDRRRIGRVAGQAAVVDDAVEADVLGFVPRTHVPPLLLRVPRERQLHEPRPDACEVRPRRTASADDVRHLAREPVGDRARVVGLRLLLHEPPVGGAERAVREPRGGVDDRRAVEGLAHQRRVGEALHRLRHAVALIRRPQVLVARRAHAVADERHRVARVGGDVAEARRLISRLLRRHGRAARADGGGETDEKGEGAGHGTEHQTGKIAGCAPRLSVCVPEVLPRARGRCRHAVHKRQRGRIPKDAAPPKGSSCGGAADGCGQRRTLAVTICTVPLK